MLIFFCNHGYSDFFVLITDIVILFLCVVNYRHVNKLLANSSCPKSNFDKKWPIPPVFGKSSIYWCPRGHGGAPPQSLPSSEQDPLQSLVWRHVESIQTSLKYRSLPNCSLRYLCLVLHTKYCYLIQNWRIFLLESGKDDPILARKGEDSRTRLYSWIADQWHAHE